MVELQAEISYWLSVGIRAVQTFPSFIGNNWVGVLLSIALLFPSVRQQIKEHVAAIRPMAWSGKFFYTSRTLMKTNWRTVVMIVGIFFLGNFLTVAFRDYNGISDQNKRTGEQLASVKFQLSQSSVNCLLQTNEIRNERDSEKAKNQTLEKQDRDQQSTINGCLSQAIKVLTPEPERMTVLGFDSDNAKPVSTTRWIVLTNRTITPARIDLICPNVFESVTARIIGELVTKVVPPIRLSPNSWRIEIISPAWTPTSPLLMTASWRGNDDRPCTFRKF